MNDREVAEMLGVMDVAFGVPYRVDTALLTTEAGRAWAGLSWFDVREAIRRLDADGAKRPSPERVAVLARQIAGEKMSAARREAAPAPADQAVDWFVHFTDPDGPVLRLLRLEDGRAADRVPLARLHLLTCPVESCGCQALEVEMPRQQIGTVALTPRRWAWEHVVLRRPSWRLVDAQPMRRAA